MDNTMEIDGTVAPGFDTVREEFAAVVAEENGESGAQLAAFVHDKQVVDLWGRPASHRRHPDRTAVRHEGRVIAGRRAVGAGGLARPRSHRRRLLAGIRCRRKVRDHPAAGADRCTTRS